MNFTLLSSILRRAFRNASANPYLHLAATGTMAFSLLIIGTFSVVYVNINGLIRSWQLNIRIVAYVKDGVPEASIEGLRQGVVKLYGVEQARFVSKNEAMARLKRQLKHRLSLLDGLRENPLPASFEVQLNRTWQTWERVDLLAKKIRSFPEIDSVEYSESWLHRFSAFITFFKLASLIIGALVLATTIFVSANTIRLALYAKRDELDIMRLVGATDAFIKTPYYIQNAAEGLLGGLIATGLLFGSYKLLAARVQAAGVFLGHVEIRFLSMSGIAALLLAGILMGCFGAYLSLKQFLRP